MAIVGQRGRRSAAALPAQSSVRDGTLTVVRAEVGWQAAYVRRLIAIDASVALLASVLSYVLRWSTERHIGYVALVALLPVAWVAMVAANRGYEPRYLMIGAEEFRRVFRAGVALTAAVAITGYLVNYQVSRRFVLVAIPLLVVLSATGRILLRRWLHRRRAEGQFMHRVVVVGHRGPVIDLVERLSRETHHGMRVVGACLPDPGQLPTLLEAGVPVVGGYWSVGRAVVLTGADTVAVLAAADLGPEQLRRLAWELEPTGAELVVAPSLVEVAGPRLSIRPVSGLPLLHVEQPSFGGGRRLLKSAFDRVSAACALVLLSPLLLGIAAAIKIDSRGPVFFKQVRIGKDRQPFVVYKFRSMVQDAERYREDLLCQSDRDGLMFKMRRDPRVTRVGRWLRRYSLDELPQLINVVLGQMSLVGPRPPLPVEVEGYDDVVHRRLLVPPGVTGLWQVSGRADLSWEESVRLDLRYVDNWSFAFDMLILWKTVQAVLSGRGAY